MVECPRSQLERVFPRANYDRSILQNWAKAIRTAGSNAENCKRQLATSVALLIELEAQFYKLVTINQCRVAYTCEMVNKSSKSNLCYIDSDPIVIETHFHFGKFWNFPDGQSLGCCRAKGSGLKRCVYICFTSGVLRKAAHHFFCCVGKIENTE